VAKKDPETKPAKTEPVSAKEPAATDAAKATPSKKGQPVPIHGPDSLIDRLYPHIKKIAVGAIALFAVIGGWVAYRYMQHRHEASNTTKISGALDLARAKVTTATPDPKKATKETTFATAKERAQAAADAFAEGGSAAKKNGVYQASLLMDAGKLDDAEALYKAHTGDEGLDGALAREGLGYVYEARAAAAKDAAEQQKHYAEALDAFKQVQLDDKGPRRDYALYDQARMLHQLGKNGEAKAALDKALEVAPKSEIKGDIEAQLALVEAP
jgi:tetratricopeptide (TPR) repeat protein